MMKRSVFSRIVGSGARGYRQVLDHKQRQTGAAMVEFALTMPILLTVLLGVIDLSRAIQFDNVLTHMSREGANIAARAKSLQPGQIIDALSSTAAPLDMRRDGMIYITEIKGNPDGTGRIVNQYRAAEGRVALDSRLWHCPAWTGESKCQIGAARPSVTLPARLRDGEVVWAVESRYRYGLFTRYVLNAAPDLYAITVM